MPKILPKKRQEFDEKYFHYQRDFLSEKEAEQLLICLWQDLDWQQYEITLFGRKIAQPRLSAWYGDPGTKYRYSGLNLEPLAWKPRLLTLKKKLDAQVGCTFNSVLANAYRSGEDSMGWHSDNEPELLTDPIIAAISLGEKRRFLLKKSGESQSRGILLEPGSLLLMKRGCQRIFQHSLPKTRVATGLRISLTFRQIRNQLPL